MVESIKNTINRMEPRKANNNNAVQKTADKTAATSSSGDSVKLKSAENLAAIREMAASAPIDRANVDRIKDAIKRGEYPIDINRISDALLDAYKEMKS